MGAARSLLQAPRNSWRTTRSATPGVTCGLPLVARASDADEPPLRPENLPGATAPSRSRGAAVLTGILAPRGAKATLTSLAALGLAATGPDYLLPFAALLAASAAGRSRSSTSAMGALSPR